CMGGHHLSKASSGRNRGEPSVPPGALCLQRSSCWPHLPYPPCFLSMEHLCTLASKVVTVQKGPLYQVRAPMSHCGWSIYLPSAPEREVQIVSTVDPSFPYAIYIPAGLEQAQRDALLLHITNLQDRDGGEYECHTPNTDERYFGSYSAKMNLPVIADTLSASMAPQVLTRTEGDAVELTCEVSKLTAQQTHLSVGWHHLYGAGEHRSEEVLTLSEEVLTLSKGFVLKPGPSYTWRFLVGNVQLDKVGSTSYKLSIEGAELSDQGQLYCKKAEWIEDPDGMWKDTSRKQTGRTLLVIMSQATPKPLHLGDALILLCEVQGATSPHPGPWVLVTTMEQDGTLSLGSAYQDSGIRGSLRLEKASSGAFTLVIPNTLDEDDGGRYGCEVREWSRGQSWTEERETAVTVRAMGELEAAFGCDSGWFSFLIAGLHIQEHWLVQTGQQHQQRIPGSLLQGGTGKPGREGTWGYLGCGRAGDKVGERQGRCGAGRTRSNPWDSGTGRRAAGVLAAMEMRWLGQGDVPHGTGVARGRISVLVPKALSSRAGLGLHATLRSQTVTVRYGQCFELMCQVSDNCTLKEVPGSVRWFFQHSLSGGHYQELDLWDCAATLPGESSADEG
uniref:Ig-like domain-containing protein n=1 Tax=Amazona collaria TaxID=241587 RepID=A0A8B9FAF8_9PSIT